MEVDMAPISDSVTCLIKDTCTSISCCMDVEFMKTSFEAYLALDACNYSLDIGIEKLSFHLSLNDITFGISLYFIKLICICIKEGLFLQFLPIPFRYHQYTIHGYVIGIYSFHHKRYILQVLTIPST